MTSTGELDGLRTWQAVVVRLWSASDNAFATLTLTCLPEGARGAPWTAHLQHGDDDWSQRLEVTTAPTPSQALHRLWQRVQPLRKLFEEGPEPMRFLDDLPDEGWLTAEEQSALEQLRDALQPRQPIALRLSYRPELGLSSRWIAVLADPQVELPHGVVLQVHGDELAQVCQLVIEAATAI